MTTAYFTKRKFQKLELKQQHKKCAELLRENYELLLNQEAPHLDNYNQLLTWMKLNLMEQIDLKSMADRYHWHLNAAGKSLKEHNLLPHIRKGDHTPKADFLPIAIYLDNVRSAYNVGSILRTMEALRIGSLHFSEKTPFIDNEKVQHTSMGSSSLVPCFEKADLLKLPRPFIALETSDDAEDVSHFIFPKSFTLILGNEEYGISDRVLSEVDMLVEIPLLGAKNSINISCAFAIAASRIRNQF